jgi:hypothetical protein
MDNVTTFTAEVDWPRLALHRVELRGPLKAVLTTLSVMADESGVVVASGRVIARLAGVSERSVSRAARFLQRAGLLEVVPRHDADGSQRENGYRLLVKSLRGY